MKIIKENEQNIGISGRYILEILSNKSYPKDVFHPHFVTSLIQYGFVEEYSSGRTKMLSITDAGKEIRKAKNTTMMGRSGSPSGKIPNLYDTYNQKEK